MIFWMNTDTYGLTSVFIRKTGKLQNFFLAICEEHIIIVVMYTSIQEVKSSHAQAPRASASPAAFFLFHLRKTPPFFPRTGFSIVEMIIVILIVGILAGLAIPRFAAFFVMKLEGGRKKVIYDIRYVQQMAVARHTNTRIVFNTGNETYSAEEESPQGSGTWVAVTSPFTRAGLQVNFTGDYQYNGIDLTSASFSGSSTLQFDWKGIPVNGGTVVLTYKGENRTITVESNTGFVR